MDGQWPWARRVWEEDNCWEESGIGEGKNMLHCP
jgi:hypothetical protein